MDEHCPNCGENQKRPSRGYRLLTAYRGYRRRHRQTFENNAVVPWEDNSPPLSAPVGGNNAYFEARRERPARAMNIESDFISPLLQAMGLIGFVTLSMLYLAWQMEFAWHLACFTGLVAGGLFYLIIVLSNRRLLWVAESIIKEDLDGDGQVGQPQPPPSAPVSLEIVHKDENNAFQRMFRFELPKGISEAKFQEYAYDVAVTGKSLTQNLWTGRGKLFSKPKYVDLIDVMVRTGLVAWHNPEATSQGCSLTDEGRRTLRRYALASFPANTIPGTQSHANDEESQIDLDFSE